MSVQFVQKDQGGTLYVDVNDAPPARWDSSPTPTVTLYSRTGGEIVASQNATEGTTTTLDAAAASGQTTIPVTSESGFSVGDILCVGPNSSGQWEWVTLDTVSTGQLTSRDKLAYTYASADAIKSHRLSVSVSAAEADGIYEHARAVWDFDVSSVARTVTTRFHISVWSPRMTLRDQDVLIRSPQSRYMANRQRLQQLIEEIWDRDVIDALGARVSPGAMVSSDDMRQVHLYKVLLEIAIMDGKEEDAQRFNNLLEEAWQNLFAQTLIDTDGDGNIDDNDVKQPFIVGKVHRIP